MARQTIVVARRPHRRVENRDMLPPAGDNQNHSGATGHLQIMMCCLRYLCFNKIYRVFHPIIILDSSGQGSLRFIESPICAPLPITCDNEIKGTCGIKNVVLRSAPSALVSALLNHTHVIIRRSNKIIPFDMQTWINPAKIHKFNKTSIHLRCGAG